MGCLLVWQWSEAEMERSSLNANAARAADTSADDIGWQRFMTMGGILGALALSSCCILPLILFSVGLGGAWVGNLTALAPYKPLFATATAGLIGYGFYLAYRKPKQVCPSDGACAQHLPNRLVKLGLWTAAILATIAFAYDYVALLLFA
jgi:mercuric ion transport protein